MQAIERIAAALVIDAAHDEMSALSHIILTRRRAGRAGEDAHLVGGAGGALRSARRERRKSDSQTCQLPMTLWRPRPQSTKRPYQTQMSIEFQFTVCNAEDAAYANT